MPPDPRQENRLDRDDNRRRRVMPIEGKKGEGTERAKLTRTQESNQSRSSRIVEQREAKAIEIKAQGSRIHSVAFLADAEHILGGSDGKIRCWLVKDGREVGTPMDANDKVYSLAVSQDGKWIVAGTVPKMIVWNAKSREKVNEFEHYGVEMVDVSPDGTKIASLSVLGTVVVWSLSTGQQLFKLEHLDVTTIKFSRDSRLLASGCQPLFSDPSLRIHDTENGQLLVNFRFRVSSLAWTSDSKQLFALSLGGTIRCLDVSSGKTLSEWSIPIDAHSVLKHISLSLSSHDTFISSCVNKSLSFWDTATHQRIGSVIHLPYSTESMAMSAKYDLVISGDEGIILYNLREILPFRYIDVQYTDARSKIREIINETISKMPLELIDTKNGHLLDRREQAEAFEADSIFNELVSSMITAIDDERIKREVEKFYEYVMLSHRWQLIEPRYKDVKNTKVFKLKAGDKLKAFCKLVCSLGFRWAWCDTCCVDQDNNVVLQESLVAMFTWYRGSTLTIVYLHDVPSKSFSDSEWNKRAWTFQEYVAAETVRFYTKDWKPYLRSELPNHKESPEIILEMQRLSQVTADQMTVLRPGRDRVREKLFLASKRRSTRVEDTAYSLLGIFGVSIPVIYGEGTRAVGRFLEHILKGSGDITILAWTGTANEYNTCLPLNLTVYDSLEPPHIPHMETARLDREVSKLNPSIPDFAAFFKELKSFLSPSNSVSLDSGRLRLHCISFDISKLVLTSGPDAETSLRIYDATTTVFGNIEIKTTSELIVEKEHIVVHPWILPLLGQEYSRGSAGLDETKKALRLIVRLRQPFGALLLEEVSATDHKRVAADSLIMARIPEEVPLLDLVNNIKSISVQ